MVMTSAMGMILFFFSNHSHGLAIAKVSQTGIQVRTGLQDENGKPLKRLEGVVGNLCTTG
jgi:hypothetical protein